MAVQGGLLTTAVAGKEGKAEATDVTFFLLAKLASYVILGFGLGALGSAIKFGPGGMGVLQITAAAYMLGVAMAMLDLHPFFRRFLLQTPRFLGKFIRQTAKSGDRFAPVVLGASTVFLPCGTTQAMMALAVASGSLWAGGAILGAFVLGTVPLFFILGLTITRLNEISREKFRKVAAYVVLATALFSVNSGLVSLGSPVTAQTILSKIDCLISFCPDTITSGTGTGEAADEVTITFLSNRYEVDNPIIRAGSKVKFNLVNREGYGCIQALNIPGLGISKVVPPGTSDSFEAVVPKKPGKLSFSCTMGMYTGQFTVIK